MKICTNENFPLYGSYSYILCNSKLTLAVAMEVLVICTLLYLSYFMKIILCICI